MRRSNGNVVAVFGIAIVSSIAFIQVFFSSLRISTYYKRNNNLEQPELPQHLRNPSDSLNVMNSTKGGKNNASYKTETVMGMGMVDEDDAAIVNVKQAGPTLYSLTQQDDVPAPAVHMVAVADAFFAEKYHPIFEKNQQYANFHNYTWHVIGTDNSKCSELHKDYFFRKHCMVAEWMESLLNNDDVVVVFDSDVVPYRFNESLKNWTSNGEDIVLYERIWNTEIAAGNYIARNNPRARSFLREWSKFEYEMPPAPAFSSSDNGAIHLHVRRVVGLEGSEEGYCGQLYHNLTATVENLVPYYQFVECSRQNMTAGRMNAADGSGLTLRLLGKAEAWVVDGSFDSFKPDEFGPVFHHGVKSPFTADAIQKYDLNLTVKQNEVSCGSHYVPFCSMCVIDLQTGEWIGESWCNGDCTWIEGVCVLIK